jgi:hypothetical protein
MKQLKRFTVYLEVDDLKITTGELYELLRTAIREDDPGSLDGLNQLIVNIAIDYDGVLIPYREVES